MLWGGVAACHGYGVCTVVWQHVMGMVSVVLDVLGATVWGVNCWVCWV